MEIPFRIICELGFYTIFCWLVSLNPPPWNPSITWTSVPLSWVNTVAAKHSITAYLLLLAAHVLLSFAPVRRFFKLKKLSAGRLVGAIYVGALLMGALLWTVDSVVSFFAFNTQGQTFWEVAVLNVSFHVLFMRNMYILVSVIGGVFVARFFTERARAEAELAKYREHLEELVGERTAQLEDANKELEAFAYSVSHDLRAPLRAIDGFSQALLEDYGPTIDEEGQGHLDRVRAGTQRMGWLIDDLLQLSRMSRAEMRYETVDLSAIAEEAAEELRRGGPERKVEFAIAPGLTGRGDANLLRVALVNLLGNAWKFSAKRDGARIEFGVEIEDKEGQTVYFVRDNGAGFDMAFADKLFGAFQRLHGASEFPGEGIGLATVQRIIRRHGGRVWATGAVDKGAAFYFTLRTGAGDLE
ncbi:MAG: hypothetical protein JEZ11_04095 [Desulfobacterales bacterium]|nr:hypothetical protein [Desulfobacterales bacterium]